MKIEWASHFNPDGSRCRPPASTMHGWLAKMRGTLVGNEELRSKGMREMERARADRKYNARKNRQQRPTNTGKSLFSFLGFGKKGHSPQRPQSRRSTGTRQSTRPSYKSSSSSHRSRNVRPPPRPSGPSHRSGHRSQRDEPRTQPHHGYSSGHRRSSRR